jgi:hypothetical protein
MQIKRSRALHELVLGFMSSRCQHMSADRSALIPVLKLNFAKWILGHYSNDLVGSIGDASLALIYIGPHGGTWRRGGWGESKAHVQGARTATFPQRDAIAAA